MNIFWACVFFTLGQPVVVVEVSGTKEGCVAISKNHPGSICHPVSVRDKLDAETQLKALNELIK
jgi:hypothetical protein